ncbi:MAG: SDR family NAD(P)-dependent oxidoreductase [Bacteriovoracaceae bacterium]|nr:SDR family NAD(P)-dependent oxidoreductase [Bacteriovoracaceae bacterium]
MPIILVKSNEKRELIKTLSNLGNFKKVDFQEFGSGKFSCALVYNKKSELAQKIIKIKELLIEKDEYFSTREGIFFCGDKYDPEQAAFLFPGQGSQYRTMLQNYLSYPVFKKEFEQLCDYSLKKDIDVRSMIHGESPTKELNDTRNAQPALAAVCWSAYKLLDHFGIKPSSFAGHSFGELVSLAAGNCYSSEFLMKLSIERGRLMSKADSLSPGKMIAIVNSSSENWIDLHSQVEGLMVEGELELANINTHGQLVYSGKESAVIKFKEFCTKKKIKNTILGTSAAFHSSLMEPISNEFQKFLKSNQNEYRKPHTKVFSNLSNREYTTENDIVENLSLQLTHQVDWVGVIGSMYQSGIRIFYEVGPRTILGKMVKNLIPTEDSLIISLDGDGDFESVLAISSVIGFPISYQKESVQKRSEKILNLNTQNKIVSGFMEKQKKLLKKLSSLENDEKKEQARNNILSHTEEVLHKYYELDLDTEELVTDSNVSMEVSQSDTDHPVAIWVKNEISRLTGFETSEISDDADFDSELSLDSITKMELFSGLVGEFGSELGDVSGLVGISNIRDLVNGLESNAQAVSKHEAEMSPEQQWVREEIARYTGISASEIGLEKRFTEDLMLDSIMKMDLFSAFSRVFPNKNIEMELIGQINCLKDLEIISKDKVDQVAVKVDEKKETKENKKFSKIFKERLSFYLGVPADQIQSTSNFEYDLNLNIFEKEDLMNSLVTEFPYFQLAGRELLNTQSVGDLMALEKSFDRRSSERSDDEEVERYSFERIEIEVKKDEDITYSDNLIFCPLLVEKGFDKIETWLNKKTKVSSHPVSSVSDVENIIKKLNSINSDETIDILFVLSPLAKLDLRSWEIQMEKYISFLYRFSRELIHVFKAGKQVNIKLLLDGSRDAFVKGTVGFFRSLVKEIEINVNIVDMVWDKKSGNEIPWPLLWQQETHTENSCHYFFKKDKKYFYESLKKSLAPKHQKLDIPEEPKILLLGGARGITAEISKFLSEFFNGKIFAIGRTQFYGEFPYPEHPTNRELREFLKTKIDNEFELKDQESRNRIFNSEFEKIVKQREIFTTKDSVERRGGTFHYFKGDVTNIHELQNIVTEIEKEYGSLDGLIHAPGVIQDSLLDNKEFNVFEKVIKTKVQSALNLYTLFKNRKNLSFVCFFSSLSSWSGAPGQTDYSLANEIVNVIAEHWNDKNHCKVSSLLWSIWTETGLASSSLINQMSLLKLGGISNRAGVRLFKEELVLRGLSEKKVLFSPRSTLDYSLKARSHG